MELSTSEAVGWAALVIFVCGWFFILGIFVGRGLVPVPGEKEPARLYFAKGETPFPEPAPAPGPETITAEGRSSGPDGEQGSPKPVLPTVSEEAVKAIPEKDPPAAPVEEKSPSRDKAPPPADSPSEVTPAGTAVTAPAVDKASGNKPAETGGKIFTLQVAAVRDRRAADQCYEKLKKNKYAPDTVQTIQSGGVTWYRLRCGQFASHDEAAPVIERLRKDGFSPILVRR